MMQLHVIPITILIAYVVLTLVVANVVLRKSLGAEHFLAAGRQLPVFMVLVIILGDWLGGGSTIGVSQRGYTEGIIAWLYPISIGIALFVLAFTMAARFRRLGAVTVPEVMGRLFDEKTRLASSIFISFAYFVLGITQIIAGGALLSSLLGVDKWVADLLSAVIFLVIVVAGGLHSIALVNVIQCMVIFVGMSFALFFSLSLIGGSVSEGFNMLIHKLPPSFWSFESISPVRWSGEVLSTVFACFAAQAAITGVFAAKDTKSAVTGTWIAAALIIPIGVVYVLVGMCARVYFGNELPFGLTAGPAMILSLHPVVAGIALCGILAAIVSTGPLCFLAPTQILMRDIYSVYINKKASDKKILLFSRILAAALIIAGFVIGIIMYDLLRAIFWAFTLRCGMAVLLLSVAYLGARRVSEDGAFWSLIVGFVIMIIWTVLGSPYNIHIAIPTIVSVFISAVFITAFRKRRLALSQEVQQAYYPHKIPVSGNESESYRGEK
jgi:SSS family solute:Na+ symporter